MRHFVEILRNDLKIKQILNDNLPRINSKSWTLRVLHVGIYLRAYDESQTQSDTKHLNYERTKKGRYQAAGLRSVR